MNNTLESYLAAHRSANKSRQAKFRAKKREEKKQQEEETKQQEEEDFKRDECSEFPQFYEGPDPNEDKKKREARWKRIRRNNKAERRILKVERDLKEKCLNLRRPDLYHERPSGESGEQQRVRRLKIRRGLKAAEALGPDSQNETGGVEEDGGPNETDGVDARAVRFPEDVSICLDATQVDRLAPKDTDQHIRAMEKLQSNAMLVDQVVEEGLNETGGVGAKSVHLRAEDGRMHSVDEGFEACQEDRRLGFQVGDMVEVNSWEYAPGTIIATCVYGNGYLIRLPDDGSVVWATADIDKYFHAAVPLRFPLGFRVEANMGQFYAPGKVIAHYDNGRAYRIQLDDTQQEVWAREDSDQFVRAAAPVCHDHSRVRYTGHGFIKYPNGTVYWGNSVRALREMYRGVRKKM